MAELVDKLKAYEDSVKKLEEATKAKETALEALRAAMPKELMETLTDSGKQSKGSGGTKVRLTDDQKGQIATLIVAVLKKAGAKGLSAGNLQNEVRKQIGNAFTVTDSAITTARSELLKSKPPKIEMEGEKKKAVWKAAK